MTNLPADYTQLQSLLTTNLKVTGNNIDSAGTALTATNTEINALASSGATNADLVKLHAVTATAAEVNTNAGVTAGTAAASKTAVLGASKNLDTLLLTTAV